MMKLVVPRSFVAAWLIGRLCLAVVMAQEPTLTKDSEESFRRFMYLAQQGALGADVNNVNISLAGVEARVELVRNGAPVKVLLLRPKRSNQSISRYFDVVADENASAADAEMVGRALDQCFVEDPFQFAGLEESLASGPPPSIADAWAYGGWRGMTRFVERRMMAMASLQYTTVMIIGLAIGFLVSVVVLWNAPPAPRS